MKITKSDLIAIINEEVENVLNEGYGSRGFREPGFTGYGDYRDKTEDDYDPRSGMSYIDAERERRKHRKPYKKSPTPIKVGSGLNANTEKYKERIEAYLRDVTYDKFLDDVVTNHIIRDKKNISGPQMRVADKIMGLDPE
jgi:hypothetical protein